MIHLILRRLGWALFVVWATVSIAFLVNYALPTDPARMVAGAQARPQDVVRIRKELGLDRSLAVQYGHFMTRIVHWGPTSSWGSDKTGPTSSWGSDKTGPTSSWGSDKTGPTREPSKEHATCGTLWHVHVDLGRSYQQRRPVVTILVERLPRTILLAITAAFVQVVLGVTAGVLAASRKKTIIDNLAVSGSLLGISTPTFVIGLFLQWLFAVRMRLLPLDGYGDTATEHAASVVLPALTLGIFGAAFYTRMVRDEMIGQLSQDYVRTARAKGLSGLGVTVRHALRNALTPIVTILGLEVGTLVGGAIVTESIFRWPGIGSLSVTAMLDRDGPLVMGCVIITAFSVVFANVAVDVAYRLLDPRARAE